MAIVVYEFLNINPANGAFAQLEDDGGRLTFVIGDNNDEFGIGLDAVDVAQLVEALRPYHD